ncbi:hypothetical protein ACN28E_35400 [Archangium lansingense]|uniref:hypothetical protein n=1 Tax=Archangium lansingense TaxID=2995310 RepID=UPI003B7C6D5A
MRSDLGRRVGFSRRSSGQRLGLTVGLVAVGVSGLLPLPVRAQEVPSGVVFLVDNSESMQDFPQYLPEVFTPGWNPPVPNPGNGQRGQDSEFGHFINTGCTDPALVAAMSWFDKDSPDAAKNGSVIYDNDADFGTTPFFEPGKFYHARGRRVAWQTEDFPWSLNSFNSSLSGQTTALYACYEITNWKTSDGWYNSEVMQECEQCLATKGWWRGPLITSTTGSMFNDDDFPPARKEAITGEAPPPPEAYRKWVLSGRVLNLRPPKFVIARKALKDVISTVSNTRMGVATLGKDHGWYDPPELLEEIRPTCDQSYPTINEVALNRPRLRQAVNQVVFRNDERSIGEALFGLGGYFSSQVVDQRWQSWFQQPISPGYFGWPGCCNGGTFDDPYTGRVGAFWGVDAQEWLKPPFTNPVSGVYLPGQPWEGSGYDKSVCNDSQSNAIIVVTGGTPRSDNTVPITKMMDILESNGARHPDGSLLTFDPANPDTNPNVGGVNYCHLFGGTKEVCDYTSYNWPTGHGVGNKNFMDDVAFFLSHTDLRGDMPGSQKVRTFVIGYGDSSPMLQSIALAGQGSFFRADQPSTLRDALLFALSQSRVNSCSAP